MSSFREIDGFKIPAGPKVMHGVRCTDQPDNSVMGMECHGLACNECILMDERDDTHTIANRRNAAFAQWAAEQDSPPAIDGFFIPKNVPTGGVCEGVGKNNPWGFETAAEAGCEHITGCQSCIACGRKPPPADHKRAEAYTKWCERAEKEKGHAALLKALVLSALLRAGPMSSARFDQLAERALEKGATLTLKMFRKIRRDLRTEVNQIIDRYPDIEEET